MENRTFSGLLTVAEACDLLGVSRTTLLAAEEDGLLAPFRTPGGHRRYDRGQLHELLGRGRPQTRSQAGSRGDRGRARGDEPAGDADVQPPRVTLRDGLRELVLLLDLTAAGIYLVEHDRELRLAASFGIPRWLVTQLEQARAPSLVLRALGAQQHQAFDCGRERFPHDAARGQGITTLVRHGDEPLGVLFAHGIGNRALLAGEARMVDAAGFYLGWVAAQQRQLADLTGRLETIRRLAGQAGGGTAHA